MELFLHIISRREIKLSIFDKFLNAEESFDAVYITGTPNLELIIKGGTHGAIGAVFVHCV